MWIRLLTHGHVAPMQIFLLLMINAMKQGELRLMGVVKVVWQRAHGTTGLHSKDVRGPTTRIPYLGSLPRPKDLTAA